MKFFALLPLLALLSSLIGSSTAIPQSICTEPDMVMIDYPSKAAKNEAMNKFYMNVFDEDFEESKPRGRGGRKLEPNLRGGRNLCNLLLYKKCLQTQSSTYCAMIYSCGTAAIVIADEGVRGLQAEVQAGIPAEFKPELYNCVDKGNKRFVEAAKNATKLDFTDDDIKPQKARLIHCCLK